MSDNLANIARRDQLETELNACILPACAALKMLTANGMPEPYAAAIAYAYAQEVIERHFALQATEYFAEMEPDE